MVSVDPKVDQKVSTVDDNSDTIIKVTHARYADEIDREVIDEFVSEVERRLEKHCAGTAKFVRDDQTIIDPTGRHNCRVVISLATPEGTSTSPNCKDYVYNAMEEVGCLHPDNHSSVEDREWPLKNSSGSVSLSNLLGRIGYKLEKYEMVSFCTDCQEVRKPLET